MTIDTRERNTSVEPGRHGERYWFEFDSESMTIGYNWMYVVEIWWRRDNAHAYVPYIYEISILASIPIELDVDVWAITESDLAIGDW